MTRDPLTMMTLWQSFLVPRIDFCSVLMSNMSLKSMQSLEGLQRTFTSRINTVSNLDYWSRLKQLGLFSIHRRFERYLIIFVWKVIENLVAKPAQTFDMTDTNSRTGRKFVLYHLPKKLPVFNSPINKAKRLFNSLPKEIRNLSNPSSLECFKGRLDQFLHTVPDEPSVPSYVSSRPANSNSLLDQIHYRVVSLT